MSAFLIGVIVLTAVALLFVLPPLLRRQPAASAPPGRDQLNLAVLRDQLRELDADLASGTIGPEAHDSARRDLERRVAQEVRPPAMPAPAADRRWSAWLVGLAVPVAAASLYLLVGTPAALDPVQTGRGDGAHDVTQQQIEAMVEGLAQKLRSQPDNAEGWRMLARSYDALGRFDEASAAYAHLARLTPDDASMLADYADTLAMARGRSLQGEPEKLVARALAADPQHVKALALAGSAAYERRDYGKAVAHWKKILVLVPPDSELARTTAGSIAEAEGLMGASPSASAVAGTVELDPALRGQVADTDTVFIFARAADGPRVPLAVLRKRAGELPLKFVLDDSMSMTPQARLSDFPLVVVGARISKTGSATPAPGDLEGVLEPVRPGSRDLKIRIAAKK